MSRLSDIEDGLMQRWKVLSDQWNIACEQWNDPVRHKLEREIWSEYERVVPEFIRELDKLDELFQQARREVR